MALRDLTICNRRTRWPLGANLLGNYPLLCSYYLWFVSLVDNKFHRTFHCDDARPFFSYFKILINTEDENHEIILDQSNLLYALIGPVNTYYFAFDTEFNSKLTKFMNYLFFDVKGSLIYGHFSALLEPEKYFTTKTKIDTIQTPCSTIEWIIV